MRSSVVACVCLLAWPQPAFADDAKLGLVNLAREATAGSAKIDELRGPVGARAHIPLLPAGPTRSALEGPLEPPATDSDLSAVAELRRAAFDAFAAFGYRAALARIDEAVEKALALGPGPPVRAAIADLALLEGQVHLARRDRKRATAAFRFASDLTGTPTLNPGLHSPMVVAAYERAVAARVGRGELVVETETTTDVSIDREPTRTDSRYRVGAGRHLVALERVGARAQLHLVDITAGNSSTLEAHFVELDGALLIASLRAGLIESEPSPSTLAKLARAANLEVLVLVRARAGNWELAAFDAGELRLSGWVEASPGGVDALFGKPADLRLANPRPTAPPPTAPSIVVDADADDERWYQTWWGVGLIGGGALAIAAGITVGVLYATRSTSAEVGGFCGVGGPACD